MLTIDDGASMYSCFEKKFVFITLLFYKLWIIVHFVKDKLGIEILYLIEFIMRIMIQNFFLCN